MKVIACSTLALASLTVAQPRRNNWKKNNLKRNSFSNNADDRFPQLRPMLRDPLSSLDEFFSADEIAAGQAGQDSRCQAHVYVSQCRLMTNRYKYTFDAATGECNKIIWDANPFCNSHKTNNYFDTQKECENSCVVSQTADESNDSEEQTNSDDADTAGLTVEELLNMPVHAKSVFGSDSNRFADLISQYKQQVANKQKCDADMSTTGWCRGHFGLGWTFNKATNTCEYFVRGGCETFTDNYFRTEAECQSSCVSK